MKVQELVTGVFVAMGVQSGWERLELIWIVTRPFGLVFSVITELVALRMMLVNLGASGIGRLPLWPLKVTAPTWASARPSNVELAFIVMEE